MYDPLHLDATLAFTHAYQGETGEYAQSSFPTISSAISPQTNSFQSNPVNHQWQQVRAGPTAIWPTLNSPKIAGIQYYSVLNIIILKLYNVL
jgi:hypothetical protein